MSLLKKYHPILIIIAIAYLIVFPRRQGYVMLLDLTAPKGLYIEDELYKNIHYAIREDSKSNILIENVI